MLAFDRFDIDTLLTIWTRTVMRWVLRSYPRLAMLAFYRVSLDLFLTIRTFTGASLLGHSPLS